MPPGRKNTEAAKTICKGPAGRAEGGGQGKQLSALVGTCPSLCKLRVQLPPPAVPLTHLLAPTTPNTTLSLMAQGTDRGAKQNSLHVLHQPTVCAVTLLPGLDINRKAQGQYGRILQRVKQGETTCAFTMHTSTT